MSFFVFWMVLFLCFFLSLLVLSGFLTLIESLVIGTRGSPLALAQANQVKHLLHTRCGIDNKDILINIINTKGDSILNQALTDIGGKGLFTRELDEALIKGEVDLVVHSMKDLPVALREGTRVAAVLEREETHDVLIVKRQNGSNNDNNNNNNNSLSAWLNNLRGEVVVGTASLRRQAQLLQRHRELGLQQQQQSVLRVVNFRGNVQTRLKKLESGVVDATLLAVAGLNRLGMTGTSTSSSATTAVAAAANDLLGMSERGIDSFVVDKSDLLPAVAQGAVAVQCRDRGNNNNDKADARTIELLLALNHRPTQLAVTCERAFLDALDGNCRTPIAGQASFKTMTAEEKKQSHTLSSSSPSLLLSFRGLISKPDGTDMLSVNRQTELPFTTTTATATGVDEEILWMEKVGKECANEIRQQAGPRFSDYAASFHPQQQHN